MYNGERKGGANLSPFILRLEGICKRFAGVRVLSDINLKMVGGQIHAIVGENGAGKSTLMMIIGGIHQPESGAIFANDVRLEVNTPSDAQALGISMVYQELSLVPCLTVAENIFAGREPSKGSLFLDRYRMNIEAQAILERLESDIRATDRVEELSIAKKQLVEIAKAISRDARLIIFDEPTSSLSDTEAEVFFQIMRDLRDQGVAIVFISHRLKEVLQVSDVVTVLRDGRLVGTAPTKEIDEPSLIRMMVGREITSFFPKKEYSPGDEVLRVEGLTSVSGVKDISFTLNKGEILGVAGLVGAGRTEMAQALFGVNHKISGRIILEGREVYIESPSQAMALGICYLPEERKTTGLYLDMPMKTNIVSNVLQEVSTRLVSTRLVDKAATDYVRQFNIQAALALSACSEPKWWESAKFF